MQCRESLQGSCVSIHSSRVSLHGSRMSLHSTRVSLHGSRVSLHGSRVRLQGSRVSLHNSSLSLPCSRVSLWVKIHIYKKFVIHTPVSPKWSFLSDLNSLYLHSHRSLSIWNFGHIFFPEASLGNCYQFLFYNFIENTVAPGLLVETVARLRLRLPPPASQLAHILHMSG
jgi:hypothetical protein